MKLDDPTRTTASNDQPHTDMSTKNTLAIALTALAAGAALGVLLAPASGKETRKKLKQKGNDLRDRFSDLLKEGEALMEEMKGEADRMAATARDAAAHAKQKVEDATNSARGAANAASRG